MIESIPVDILERRARIHGALADVHRLAIVDELALSDRSPSELGSQLGIDSNLLAHHLDVLARLGLIERSESQGDRRRRYVRLVPDSLADLGVGGVLSVGRVVFVCTENAARSQLAAALWNDAGVKVPGCSGGTQPRERVHAGAMRSAERRGLSLVGARPAPIPDPLPRDLLITVCDRAHEALRGIGHSTHLHWSIPDPVVSADPNAFEAAVDLLNTRIQRLAPLVRSA